MVSIVNLQIERRLSATSGSAGGREVKRTGSKCVYVGLTETQAHTTLGPPWVARLRLS